MKKKNIFTKNLFNLRSVFTMKKTINSKIQKYKTMLLFTLLVTLPNYAFAASRMLKQVDWIINRYEAEYELKNDNYPQETKYIHDLYCGTVAEMTGLNSNYVRDPLQYVNFKKARENADEKGVDYETYIEAQFEALSFCNGIPKIEDLYGDKANQRLLTYVSKYNIPLKTHKVEEDVWSKFKQ